jgi:transposase-like protein
MVFDKGSANKCPKCGSYEVAVRYRHQDTSQFPATCRRCGYKYSVDCSEEFSQKGGEETFEQLSPREGLKPLNEEIPCACENCTCKKSIL